MGSSQGEAARSHRGLGTDSCPRHDYRTGDHADVGVGVDEAMANEHVGGVDRFIDVARLRAPAPISARSRCRRREVAVLDPRGVQRPW